MYKFFRSLNRKAETTAIDELIAEVENGSYMPDADVSYSINKQTGLKMQEWLEMELHTARCILYLIGLISLYLLALIIIQLEVRYCPAPDLAAENQKTTFFLMLTVIAGIPCAFEACRLLKDIFAFEVLKRKYPHFDTWLENYKNQMWKAAKLKEIEKKIEQEKTEKATIKNIETCYGHRKDNLKYGF